MLILEAGERRSLEVGVARKDYKFHFIRGRGWQNDCVGYHIKGDILDADRADSIIEIEGAVDMLVIYILKVTTFPFKVIDKT